MSEDILDEIEEIDEEEQEEIDDYKREAEKEQEEARAFTIKPESTTGAKRGRGRPKGSTKKGPLGEDLEEEPVVEEIEEETAQSEQEEDKVDEKEEVNEEERPRIIVVRELPIQQVAQREGIDEQGRKVRFMTIEEVLTLLVNK